MKVYIFILQILGILYWPIYVAGFLLHRLALLLLVIAYILGLRPKMAFDIFISIFKLSSHEQRRPYW